MTAGNSTIASAFTCASEFTLTVTLVVFVMVTAVLLFIILLLCVSKSFRAFFFRDAAKRKKAAAKKAAKQVAEQNAQAIDQQSGAPTQKPHCRKNARRRRDRNDGAPQFSLGQKQSSRRARRGYNCSARLPRARNRRGRVQKIARKTLGQGRGRSSYNRVAQNRAAIATNNGSQTRVHAAHSNHNSRTRLVRVRANASDR